MGTRGYFGVSFLCAAVAVGVAVVRSNKAVPPKAAAPTEAAPAPASAPAAPPAAQASAPAAPVAPTRTLDEGGMVIAAASNLQDSGDFKGAAELLEREYVGRKDSRLKLALAEAYLNEGSVRSSEAASAKKARAVLDEVEKRSGPSAEIDRLRAASYEIEGDYSKAQAVYAQALKKGAPSVDLLVSMGHTGWLAGKPAQMSKFYDLAGQTLAMDQDVAPAVKARLLAVQGLTAARARRFPEAEKLLNQALELSTSKPFRAEMLADLAGLKINQQDFKGAYEYARRSVAEDGSQELGHVNLATAALGEKELLRAHLSDVETSLLKALLLNPARSGTYFVQGRFEFVTGRHRAALGSFKKAQELLDKDNTVGGADKNAIRADILLQLAACHQLLKQPNDVLATLRKARKLNARKTDRMVKTFKPFQEYAGTISAEGK